MRWLRELLYPSRAMCLGCGSLVGQDQPWLCGACLEALETCRLSSEAVFSHASILSACHPYRYQHPVDALVRHLKYNSVKDLAPRMAADMVRALNPLCQSADVIVPVPMHPLRKMRRGLNHAELLARYLSEATGIPLETSLRRSRCTPQQARLSHEQRKHNLDNAFRVTDSLQGKAVLLVDDVCTTGTTAEQCAKALLAAGARHVCLVTYALAAKG